jgi:ATP-dependent RNA helicase SUPV3L1/SUV3
MAPGKIHLSTFADLRMPHTWFSKARSCTRDVHYHYGPTNSGKTHTSLESLKKAKTGIYCGPLRLLATEVFEKLNAAGVLCNLVTGQECIKYPGATHTACTIEIADTDTPYDCAVIDEIQLIGDTDRGSAWTNALLGLNSPEIHLAGDSRPLKLIQNLCETTQDKLHLHEYTRRSVLQIDNPINSVDDIRPGDCLVAFSRKTCHTLRRHVENKFPGKCSIIYGSLPPENRREQAKKFNLATSDSYLVSTDAIGMGLNYNINRIIFYDITKNDGNEIRKLHAHEVMQIAGRAGRGDKTGFVTACDVEDLEYIKQVLETKQFTPIERAALFPTFEQIEMFADEIMKERSVEDYGHVLRSFEKMASLDNRYFLQSIHDHCRIAGHLRNLNLPLKEMYTFTQAPIRLQLIGCVSAIKRFARDLVSSGEVKLALPNIRKSATLDELEEIYFSNLYIVIELYIWLSQKYESTVFVDSDLARALREECCVLIQAILDKIDLRHFKRRRTKS